MPCCDTYFLLLNVFSSNEIIFLAACFLAAFFVRPLPVVRKFSFARVHDCVKIISLVFGLRFDASNVYFKPEMDLYF